MTINCPRCNQPVTCARCDAPLTGRYQRRYCSQACTKADLDDRRDSLIEDVTHLHRSGVAPAEIAQRVGLSTSSVSRMMYRYGEVELARIFTNARDREDRKQCVDCGASISRGSKRCRPCGYLARRYEAGAA